MLQTMNMWISFVKGERVEAMFFENTSSDYERLNAYIRLGYEIGKIEIDDIPKEVFKKYKLLESIGLSAPETTYIIRKLRKKGFDIDEDIFSLDELRDAIVRDIKKRRKESD